MGRRICAHFYRMCKKILVGEHHKSFVRSRFVWLPQVAFLLMFEESLKLYVNVEFVGPSQVAQASLYVARVQATSFQTPCVKSKDSRMHYSELRLHLNTARDDPCFFHAQDAKIRSASNILIKSYICIYTHTHTLISEVSLYYTCFANLACICDLHTLNRIPYSYRIHSVLCCSYPEPISLLPTDDFQKYISKRSLPCI